MNPEHKRVLTRRHFVTTTATLAGAAIIPSHAAPSKRKPTAVDQVTLGKTGLKLSRLGIGTGSKGGSIQRKLGREGFTKLIRYAYDQGITYIDTAQGYRTHDLIRDAIKGLPREKLFIQTKMRWNNPEMPRDPLGVLDRFRKELGVDYIDSLLVHCAVKEGLLRLSMVITRNL